MKNHFIKVVNQGLAEQLVALGFQYIMEQGLYVFLYDEKLLQLLQSQFSSEFVVDNKLRF